MTWTPTRIEQARIMWADGKSGSEIAREIGKTRSAVLGQLFRLGLMGRGRTGKPACQLKANRPRKPRPPQPVRTVAQEAKRPARVVEPAPTLQPPLNLTIYDLTRLDCRAIASPDRAATTLYCGHPIRPGSAYCPAHHARFHQGATNEAKKTDRLAHDPGRVAEAPRSARAVVSGRVAKAGG